MLRVEDAYIRRKLNEEIVLNISFETVQPRARIHQSTYNEESCEVTRRKLTETSGMFVRTSIRIHHFLKSL